MDVIACLVQRAGETVSHADICRATGALSQAESHLAGQLAAKHVSFLRRELCLGGEGKRREVIHTMTGKGYKFSLFEGKYCLIDSYLRPQGEVTNL